MTSHRSGPSLPPLVVTFVRLTVNTTLTRVRATYTTPNHGYKIDPTLLIRSISPPATTTNNLPAIVEVKSSNFVPSLLPSEIEKVENLLAQKGPRAKKISEEVKKMVQGTKEEIRPDVSGEAWKQRNARQCAACETVQEKDLATCSRSVSFILGLKRCGAGAGDAWIIIDRFAELTHTGLSL